MWTWDLTPIQIRPPICGNLWKHVDSGESMATMGSVGILLKVVSFLPRIFSALSRLYRPVRSQLALSQPIWKATAMDSSWRNFQFPTVQKTKSGRSSDLLWKTWTQNSTSHTPIPWQTENISVAVLRTHFARNSSKQTTGWTWRSNVKNYLLSIQFGSDQIGFYDFNLCKLHCLSLYRNDFFPSLDEFQKTMCQCQHVSTP